MKALTLAVVSLTLAAAACGGDGPQSAGPVPTVREGARPATSPAQPTSSPSSERVGLPPVGATPSVPERGELVLQWSAKSTTLASADARGACIGPVVHVRVYADGRVIWDRDKGSTGFLEQRLTPEGVELLRTKLIASGLFDRSLTLDVPEGHGCLSPGNGSWGSAEARRDGGLVRLLWNCPYGPCESTTATPKQVSALRRLDALFTDPVSLPSNAWADRRVRAYVPSHFAVCINTSPPTDVSRLLSLLPAQAEELLRDKSWTSSEDDVVEALEGGRIKVLGRSVEYCSMVATDEAREVAEALSVLDRDTRGGSKSLAYLVAEGVNNWETTSLRFEPYFPHGEFRGEAQGHRPSHAAS